MKAGFAFLPAVGSLLISCSEQAPMTTEQMVKNIDQLNGKTVTVSGYLPGCAGNDCVLYSDEKQAQLAADWFHRTIAAARSGTRFEEGPADSWFVNSVGIGTSSWQCEKRKRSEDCLNEFDKKAEKFAKSYVLITGRVSNKCRWHGEPGCTDRGTDLYPTDIRRWDRATGA